MTEAQQEEREIPKSPKTPKSSSCYDAYFERIQARKKLPSPLQENLTYAFSKVPVSSFQALQGGKVIEIVADIFIPDAVRTLSEHKILSAPVRNTEADQTNSDWRERYLGIIDYSAVLLWVLESAEQAFSPSSATSAATTAGGIGSAGAVGAIGAVALGVTGPAAVAGLTAAAVCSAVAGSAIGKIGTAAENEDKDSPTTADKLTEDFDKVILQDEPCKSTTVKSIVKSFRGAPFLPVATDSSMLSILLLLSKYRMRNVPVIEYGQPELKNYITQSAVIQGLKGCKGMEWFDCIAEKSISDLGLPFMSSDEVISVQSNDLILEAFNTMKDNQIGGLPVVEGQKKKIVGNVSISDIRYVFLKHELLSNFRKLTVMDFLTASKEPGKAIPPITCTIKSTLVNVIETLASKSVHRIYVVSEEEGEVAGVITLRDVISCFIYEPPNHFDAYLGFAVKEILKKQ